MIVMEETVREAAKATVNTPETKREKTSSQRRKPAAGLSCVYPSERIVQIQRTMGNSAVERLYRSGALQAKLQIGQPNDIYEQEADRVADQVMRMSDENGDSRKSIVKDYDEIVRMKPG
jgi:hypothetical protein